MNLRSIQKACFYFLLLLSVSIPANMGLGQVMSDWTVFGSQGASPGQFYRPKGIAIDSKKRVYVADSSNDRIQMLDVNGAWSVIGSAGSAVGQFRNPHGVCIDSNDELWVADTGNLRLQHRSINGVWSIVDVPIAKPWQPNYIHVDRLGQVWFSDPGRNLICKRNVSGNWSTIGGGGNGAGQFSALQGISVSSTGIVYVADYFNCRIQTMMQDETWEIVGGFGNILGAFDNPMGVYVDRDDLLWVVDTGNHRLQRRNGDGSWSSYLKRGSGDFEVILPESMAIASDGYVWIADLGNHRVCRFLPDAIEPLPPTSNFSASPSTTWSNSDVTATITSTDNAGGSGVKEVHYSVNIGTEQVITGSSATFTLSENGTHSIDYWSVDVAGNTETTNYATVRIDKTRPTVDAYVIASLVTVVAQDTVSGVASTKVSIDGAAAVNYTGSFTVAPGAHTVTYWATDQAGNESTREVVLVGVSVASVAVSPTTLFSTKAGVGTVKLSLAAPAGGVVVMLESNSPAVSVPVSVTVPAGALSVTFPVTAGTVSTDTKAVISASVGGQEVHGTVYVLVPFPKTLTVSPTTIIGGDAGIGTVALASNAGVGGQVVNLTSSNVNVVVPATVTVPAGATSATFPVKTSIISSDIAVAISADADGSGITTTVLIKRVAPKTITFAPSSVVGGNSSVATLTVTKPAPAGGIVIDLRSVSSNVSVPSTVTIAAGATTATFPVTTVPVKKSESAMIQAYAAGVKVSAVITVTATSVVSVSLNPTTVVGGLNSTATVTLNGVAPVGGTTIQLYSTNVAASVPTSVVVPAGSKTVTFPVTTVAVAANTTASIAAKYLGTTKSAALTIAAPTVSTLTLAPSSLTGGATSKLTIKLSGKAAIGGVVVALTSSNTVIAQLPTSVTIPAGSDTVDVTIQTGAVAVTTNVTITAKTGAVAKTAVLTVNK